MTINTTSEVRTHADIDGVTYRSSWLAKCHIYHFGRDQYKQDRERRRASAINRVSSSSVSRVVPVNSSGVGGAKFGCPFCFATGVNLEAGKSTFAKAKEFIKHIETKHTTKLPTGLILQQLRVALGGHLPAGMRRWDLNLVGTP